MVQEVQTSLTGYEIPNRIEGIGISERKIKEHYQVTPTFSFECEGTAGISLTARSDHREAPLTEGTFTITQNGVTEFKVVDGGIRVPLAGGYQIDFTINGGSYNFQTSNYIKISGETFYSVDLSDSSDTKSMVINLGKFDTIKFRASGYYSGSSTSSTTNTSVTVKLKKI